MPPSGLSYSHLAIHDQIGQFFSSSHSNSRSNGACYEAVLVGNVERPYMFRSQFV
jgi:hypothetical protein